MEAIDPKNSEEYSTLQVDPKDEKIEILLAHIKDLQGMVEFLKEQLKERPIQGQFITPRPKLNTASEIRQALEARSRMIADKEREALGKEKEEKVS